jgi:hypothetical protein
MGPFFWGGIPPAVAPEGAWFSRRKPSHPLTLFKEKFTLVQPTEASDMHKRYSKCW